MVTRYARLGAVASLVTIFACAGGNDADRNETAETASPSTSNSGLQGAWRIVEMKPAEGVSSINPAGLFLFASTHYSVMFSTTAEPRTTFAQPDAATDPEKLAAYNTFIANSGKYEIVGDTLIVRPVVSKNPNYMGGGEDRFVVRLAGDTLWLTSVPGAFRFARGRTLAPLSSAPDSFKLVRRE